MAGQPEHADGVAGDAPAQDRLAAEAVADVRSWRKSLFPKTLSTSGWQQFLADRRIRRDLVKYCRTKFDKADLTRATNRLADFDGEVLVLGSKMRGM